MFLKNYFSPISSKLVKAKKAFRNGLPGLLMLVAGLTGTMQAAAQSGCTVPSFRPAVNYTVGDYPFGITTADFNKDGRPDLAVANASDDGITLLLGNGTGSFTAGGTVTTGAGPYSLISADFNNDGNPDLAAASKNGPGTIIVSFGNGNGGFAAATSYAAGDGTESVNTGDFNGDGFADLAGANVISDSVSVLLNNGQGGFAPAVHFPAGDFPLSVIAADFNGDGFTDLVTANFYSDNVSLLPGNGLGSFGTPVNFPAGSSPTSVIAGDINADGKADLVVTNIYVGQVSVLLGNGLGSFAPATTYATGDRPECAAIADLNNDGKLDIATANLFADNVSVLLGNGMGAFAAPVNFATAEGSAFVVAADFNNDGSTDLATANAFADNASVLLNTCPAPPLVITVPADTIVYSTANQCGAVVNYKMPSIPPRNFIRTFSDTFRFTGARQTYTVPASVSAITIKAWGAQGGSNASCTNNSGGLGGYAQGRLAVTANDILHVFVGEQPAIAPLSSFGDIFPGGYNGGGLHGYYAGGGGGASDVRRGDTSLASRLIVAGGGGGNNSDCNNGGVGGGLQGGKGEDNDDPRYVGGGGGTQTAGGAGGFGFTGKDGTLGQGGGLQGEEYYNAGGGGGYYGGGAAFYASAGGGSGYIGGVSDSSTQLGVNSGNGMVVITYEQVIPYTLTQTTGLPSGSNFPIGSTINTFVLFLGNTPVDTASFTVTVRDTIKPIITAPAAVTVNTNAGVCSASNVVLGTPTASDNCSAITITNNAPATFPKGTTVVTYTARDSSGNTATATQNVTVMDNEKPIITCPAAQQFCFSSTGQYTIPALQATDNCSIQSTSYTITGATTRSGMGNNASGGFAPGTSTIIFTLKDASNNVSTCSTTVRVNSQIIVIIPDSKALNSNGVAVNTVYVGYAPASSITLTANTSGGTGNYTYQWSNGVTTRSITVSPTMTTTYTVTVKDGSNCTATASKTITVIDVRCGNKLDKVSVCHNGNTICISDNAVPAHLNHLGDMLGTCNGTMAGRTMASKSNSTEEIVVAPLATIVYPNPNKGQFSVQLSTTAATKAEVQVLNAQGMVVSRKTVQTGGRSQTVSFNLSHPVAGTYLIKIVSEEGVQVLKMIIQR